MTLAKLFDIACTAVGGDAMLAAHDDPLVLGAACMNCQSSHILQRLKSSLQACPDCGGSLVPLNHAVRAGFTRHDIEPSREWTWHDLGLRRGGAVIATGTLGRKVFLFDELGPQLTAENYP
jgi:hypothetical protein